MRTVIKNARIVLENEVLNGAIVTENGYIKEVMKDLKEGHGDAVIDAKGLYVGPGFVDIHTHAAEGKYCYEDPQFFAEYHLKRGTTTLIGSLIQFSGIEELIKNTVILADHIESGKSKNLAGIHLEGPYMSHKYGVVKRKSTVSESDYLKIIRKGKGFIRQWTFAPEIPGIEPFVDTCLKNNIVPAFGHTEASPELIEYYAKKGAAIFTHTFNAAGASIEPTRFEGTLEVRADEAAMLCDNVYCEVIPDFKGVHVRPRKIKLLFKTVGIDRVIAVTDAFVGTDEKPSYPEDDIRSAGDCNFIDGLLAGNTMTLSDAFKNIKKHADLTIVDAFKVCAVNPSKAIGIFDRVGSIAPGKKADFVFLNDNFDVDKVMLDGKLI